MFQVRNVPRALLFSDDFDSPRWVSAFGISALIDALSAPPGGLDAGRLVPTIEAAADAVVSIVTVLRLSMLELMGASINAVEDQVTMGLDRSAGALLLARSDAPGAAAAQEIEAIRAAYEANGATEAFHTDDQAEGEAFMVPRRATFDAIQRLGTLLLEDAGCRYHGCRPACTGSVRSRKGARSTLCSSRMPATETPNLRSTTQPATWPRRLCAAGVRGHHGASALARRDDHR